MRLTRCWLAPAVAAVVAGPAFAQNIPTRALTRPEVEYSEPFTQITGVRELRDGRVNFTRIVCDNPIVKIQAVGWVDYKMNISFDITLSYFRAIGDAVPVVSGVMKAVDALIGMTVTVTVSGTLEKPVVKLTIL